MMRFLMIIILMALFGSAIRIIIQRKMIKKLSCEILNLEKKEDTNAETIQLLNHWITNLQNNKHIADFFIDHDYSSIAIYGMGVLGECLLTQMYREGIDVKYGIDQNASQIKTRIQIFNLSDELPQVDVIVVTPTLYFYQIESKLKDKTDCSIVSLEKVLYYA